MPTISELQADVDRWIQSIGVRYFSELTNLAQLTEEVGEVARIISRTYGEQSWKADENPGDSVKEKLADELADVLFVVVCLANQTGINLTEAIERNMQKKTTRDENRHHENPKLK